MPSLRLPRKPAWLSGTVPLNGAILGGCWKGGSGGAAPSVLTTNACTCTPGRTGFAALECSSRDLHIIGRGAQVGTTSYSFITSTIKPKTQPAVFPQNAGAVQALKNKQINGLVVDLPTAFYAGCVERLEPSGLLGSRRIRRRS